jgi:AAA+ ATPase superfamily predicted ATPase
MRKDWGFYGRATEIADIRKILQRGRWFFCAISGRRRIGKTSLIREALQGSGLSDFIYVQIPDSDERGVVQALQDALETNGIEQGLARSLTTFSGMAYFIGELCNGGFVVILDEFQYFHRSALSPFQSMLQAEVDTLRDTLRGGLIVLGSIHTEMTAILEDRNAPLFNRITDRIEVDHWDFETLFEMWAAHDIVDPAQQLFLWTLFEGVPKFYRDCYDQDVLKPEVDRRNTLRRLFFEGSSPLRDEADNWFLREFRGRYDTVLKLLARLGPCSHGTLMEEFRRAGSDSDKQLAGYLKILIDKYHMVERRLPILAREKAKRARYGITDNFLTSWLGALARNVSQARIMPIDIPLDAADKSLAAIEGFTFEKMIRQLTVECSRKGRGDFLLTEMVEGYWNKADGSDIEIDVVALNETDRLLRLGSCKRSASAHDGAALEDFDGHIARFLRTNPRFEGWTVQKALYSPAFEPERSAALTAEGYLCRDLSYFRNILFRQGASP